MFKLKSFLTFILFNLFIFVLQADEDGLKDGLYAIMDTSKGQIVLQLEFEKTPLTVTNFVGLAEGTLNNKHKKPGEPFYDGLSFHRVIASFMIQGGCPEGSGRGGPGYKFEDEIHPSLKHTGPGILSMANAGPATNGSQFFITHKATPHLDGRHTVFGHVIKGLDTVNAIAKDDLIKSIKIKRVGEKAKAFKATDKEFKELQATLKMQKEADARIATSSMLKKIKEKYPNAIKADMGYYYVKDKSTKGDSPVMGDSVMLHYTGSLLKTGKVFDTSKTKGRSPLKVAVGVGQVFPSWDNAILSMVKNEKRTLILPPELGFGMRGRPPQIPPNSFLVFELELIDFSASKISKMIDKIKDKWPKASKTKSGMYYVVQKKGADSNTPSVGDTVTAHYTGTLLDTGAKFDSSVDRKQPFQFNVGRGQVIQGWDEAFLAMSKGEKRTIILPPQLAYGPDGRPPQIPPNSFLVFDVELLDFK